MNSLLLSCSEICKYETVTPMRNLQNSFPILSLLFQGFVTVFSFENEIIYKYFDFSKYISKYYSVFLSFNLTFSI